jgi:peptidoglycan/LPS O-acetylase OafA/YrhL
MQMTPDKLTVSESLMLDVIRISASITVAYAHLSQEQFGADWANATHYARNAVAVFFVLSGFVIRYVTRRTPATLGHYLGDRASRMYSVVLPALLLTILADTIVRHWNPSFYAPWKASLTHPILHIVLSLFFLGQVWSHTVIPLTNPPYWTINYEVAYYILYGCFFYLAGSKRWLFLAAVALFYGPRVLYLAPLWIAGCLLCDLYQRWNRNGNTAAPLTIFSVAIATIVSVLSLIHTSQWQFFGENLTAPFGLIAGIGLRPEEYIFGIAWCPIFLWLLLLARQISLTPGTQFVRTTQFIAEGTFPIYLIHFPLFMLAAALLPYDHSRTAPNLCLLLGVIILGILAGHPCNIFKNWMRQHIFTSTPTRQKVLAATKS